MCCNNNIENQTKNIVKDERQRQFVQAGTIVEEKVEELPVRKIPYRSNEILELSLTISTEYKPQLQGTESAAERNLPVSVVDYGTGLGLLVSQVFGHYGQRLDEETTVLDPKGGAIKVYAEPLVRIEAEGVR
jgi:hypothetical protein